MNPYLLSIRHTPVILERLVDEIPEERFHEKRHSGRFTLLEAIAHVTDFEEVFLDRMRLTVLHPGSRLVSIDEEARVVEQNYAAKDIHHEIEVFANRRRDTIDFLESVTAEQLQLSAVHDELGEITVAQQLAIITGHDIYHIEQVTEYLTELHQLIP